MDMIENRTFDEIKPGDTASLVRRLRWEDIALFAIMSGDVNPAHVDEEYARSDMFHTIIAHGMWGASLISTLLGTTLPGPGTIYLGQMLSFHRPVTVGDTITVTVGLISPVAGQADILVVPDLESGNMLAKHLEYLADAQTSGIVLGARVPIVLTSRADNPLAHMASCALALLLAQSKRKVNP